MKTVYLKLAFNQEQSTDFPDGFVLMSDETFKEAFEKGEVKEGLTTTGGTCFMYRGLLYVLPPMVDYLIANSFRNGYTTAQDKIKAAIGILEK